MVARVVRGVGSLAGPPQRRALERAVALSRRRGDFTIVRFAARTHAVELVVEADDRVALARGMQGFQVAAARGLNRAAARSGTVFLDRYRATPAIVGGAPPTPRAGRRSRARPR